MRYDQGEACVEVFLSELETALGHTFARPDLLLRALTHRSLANQLAMGNGRSDSAESGDNERLEFLGDAVLGLVVGEALYLAHPDWSEGQLTRVRAQLVSRKHMAEVAGTIGLGNHLRISRGEDRGGLRRTSTVLSNTMEAVIGALFLDAGLDPVRIFVRRLVMGDAAEQLARELQSGAALGNYKSALQEHLQAIRAGSPTYRVVEESGPDHRKRFLVEVAFISLNGDVGNSLAVGSGSTKKLAEQDAARRALERLRTGSAALEAMRGGPGRPGPSAISSGESENDQALA
ncbi:MAG TPA: ribonuclease III [Terracidiphilus sp.]|nr:ribonuclease III [Terracidiphilus sp.]